ncbi:hypothetical protein [Aquibacillus salsiterrae]|uniref:Lipoprotein n=1 Tax=Aquibacillus salsiterrae TaxID=2950439 RepID=A0A9X3WF22_9BACI|nr:hypothetical protein [Aquibacillus salsiterrae]MDC3416239.1 hypothetical protein [Aquibacillus salsiterrae]
MVKSVISCIIFLVIILFGCADASNFQTALDDGETRTESISESMNNDRKFYSINDYMEEINNVNLKTSKLNIVDKGEQIELQIDIELSNYLKDALLNTEKPIYFTFAEVADDYNLSQFILKREPLFIDGDINNLLVNNNTISIKQSIVTRNSVNNTQKEILLNPENYQLAFLNEDKKAVAIVIGLETATIH